jgi:L-asparaginase
MEYKRLNTPARGTPRLIIHGGAGNIRPEAMTRESYLAYRTSLLNIVGGPS